VAGGTFATSTFKETIAGVTVSLALPAVATSTSGDTSTSAPASGDSGSGSSGSGKSGLSTGAKIGIGIGVALGVIVLLIGVLLLLLSRHKHKKAAARAASNNNNNNNAGSGPQDPSKIQPPGASVSPAAIGSTDYKPDAYIAPPPNVAEIHGNQVPYYNANMNAAAGAQYPTKPAYDQQSPPSAPQTLATPAVSEVHGNPSPPLPNVHNPHSSAVEMSATSGPVSYELPAEHM
jgi:hypothetical protein